MRSRLPLVVSLASSAVLFGSIAAITLMVGYTLVTGDAIDFGGHTLEQDPTRGDS